MNTKSHFLLPIILLSFSTHCTENLEQLYSNSFLNNHTAVYETLKSYGFTDITFKSSDDLMLHGLFLSRPHATCNVIICAGWFPGKMEGRATFFDLLPDYCNILFFNARGHGKSEGHLFKEVWRYGVNEYKDILGAISCSKQLNNLPIIICGMCAGAFNAAHALINLETSNVSSECNVKGLVFDSGWGSVTEISRSFAVPSFEELLDNTKLKNIKQFGLYKAFVNYMQVGFNTLHSCLVKPFLKKYEKVTNLFDKMHHIKTPIFFIHSYNDAHTNITNVIKLSTLVPNKECWWIAESFHAQHYLRHKELYKAKLSGFIESVIQ